jgi:hypothetical protein
MMRSSLHSARALCVLTLLFFTMASTAVAETPSRARAKTRASGKRAVKKSSFVLTASARRKGKGFLASNRKTKAATRRLVAALARVQRAHTAFSKRPGKALAKRLTSAVREARRASTALGRLTRKSGKQGPNTSPDPGSPSGGGEQGPNDGSRVVHALSVALSAELQGALTVAGRASRKALASTERSALGARISAVASRRSDLHGLLEPVTTR